MEGYEDGYNLSMLEAMATGMPLVATPNRTSPIRNGITGYIDPDPGVLHERLAALLEDAELAFRLGEQARSSVAEEFPLDRFTTAWESLFEELLCQGSGAAARSPAISDETPSAAFEGKVGRLLRTKHWVSARRLLEQESDQSPHRAGVFNLLGETYRLLGRDPEAAQSLWQAAWLDSSLEQARRMDPETRDGSLLEHPEKNPEVAALACICVGRGVEIGSGGSRIHPGAISIEVGVEGGACQGTRGAGAVQVSHPDISVSGYTLEMFADEELDYIVSRHHLGDYQDPLRALEEWRRVLKKGGLLAFVLPDDSHIDTLHHDTSRRHAFTPDSFRRLIRYFGDFDILHEGPCFHRWSFVAVLQKRGGERSFDYHQSRRADSARGCRRAARRWEENGDPHGALECWREAAELEPGQPADTEGQIRMLRRLGRLLEAETLRNQGGPGAPSSNRPVVAARLTQRRNLWKVRDPLPHAKPKRILLSYCANPVTTGVYLERALRKRHEVLTWGPTIDDRVIQLWNLEAVAAQRRLTDLGYGSPNVCDALRRQAPDWKPDLFLWIESGVQYPVEGLADLACPKACYLIDTHIDKGSDHRVEAHLEWARPFDYVFLAQRTYLQRFLDSGLNAYWLPLAADPEIHQDQRIERVHSVGFVGSLNQERRVALLERLQTTHTTHIERCFLQDMARVFSSSKIVFNNALNNDLNMRVFEAMACGALLLTDPAPGSGLEHFFKDGEHLAIYREDSEILELADRWLANPGEREALSKAGQAEVLAHHTYDHRVVLMETILFQQASGDEPGGQTSREESRGTTAAEEAVDEQLSQQARSLLGICASPAANRKPDARLGRGRILLSRGRLGEAEDLFSEWVRTGPAEAGAHLGLGSVAFVRGEWELAQREYREALRIAPAEAAALSGLGLALAYDGREMEATDVLIEATQKNSNPGRDTISALIRAASTVGRFVEARDAIRSHLDQQSSNPQLLFTCAVLSARGGEAQQALDLLDELEAVDPSFPDLSVWRKAWVENLALSSDPM